jgi:transposase
MRSKWWLSLEGQHAIEGRKGDESVGMINVGIDVHKRRCQACIKDEKGRLIGEVSFARDEEGIRSFHRLLQNHGEAKIVLESTGNLWVPIYDNT